MILEPRTITFGDLRVAWKSSIQLVKNKYSFYLPYFAFIYGISLLSSNIFECAFLSPLIVIIAPVLSVIFATQLDYNLALDFKTMTGLALRMNTLMATSAMIISVMFGLIILFPEAFFNIAIGALGPHDEPARELNPQSLAQIGFGFSACMTAVIAMFSYIFEQSYLMLRHGLSRNEAMDIWLAAVGVNNSFIMTLVFVPYTALLLLVTISPIAFCLAAIFGVNFIYFCLKAIFEGSAETSSTKSATFSKKGNSTTEAETEAVG